MTAAKRPSLQRKSSRKEKEKQDSALDMGIQFTIDDEVHKVTLGDLSALDIAALRKQTGHTFQGLLSKIFDEDEADIDLIAAAVWLARRVGGERALKYDDVAAEMGYDVIEKIRESQERASDDDVDEDKDADSLDPEG